ncbi:MAG TPA: lysophospholipid acyltransferase family protein [Oscillospiraceae bacterium]|nr:lysophospholipid acyltransferase family protein [Oscillospiraceae bacterium]HPS34103.1 lysophospholipid acyltransferase family protein [Oscillospiraceae bacterium]
MAEPDKNRCGEARWTGGLSRNRFMQEFIRHTLGVYIRKKFNFRFEKYTPKEGAFLLLINHTNDCDPFLASLLLPGYIRFVATEQLTEGPAGKLVSFLVNPIPRKKGASADDTVQYIRINLRLGISVAMFPEGVVSVNGQSGYFSPRTGDLVKNSAGGLITCRITGGYLCYPVWAKHPRRGPAEGKIVREYTREELDKMSVDEINAAIAGDLYVNAYEEQSKNPKRYRGKSFAEGLENALFVCPKCHGVGTMHSKKNDYFCDCGYRVTLGENGFFIGQDIVFNNVLDWDLWQREYIKEQIPIWKQDHILPITADGGQSHKGLKLLGTSGGKRRHPLIKDLRIRLYSDRLEFSDGEKARCFMMSEIGRMASHRSSRLLFTCGGRYYEAASKHEWPVFKYVALWRFLTGRHYL